MPALQEFHVFVLYNLAAHQLIATPDAQFPLTYSWSAFLSLGKSLDECADNYRKFCRKYTPKPKPESCCYWGSKLLPKVLKASEQKQRIPGQMSLPWDEWEAANSEIWEVAEKFVMANCYDPKVAAQFFNDS